MAETPDKERTGRDVNQARPQTLVTLLSLGAPDQSPWGADELEVVLRARLAAPLLDDAAPAVIGTRRPELESAMASAAPPVETLADLMHHAAPPMPLIQFLKDAARAARQDPDAATPVDVSVLLYFAAIAVALLRHGTRITSLPDAALREGLAWAGRRPWADRRTRSMFEEAVRAVGAPSA